MDKSISGAIVVFIPAVRSPHPDTGDLLLDLIDLFQELRAGEVAAVESLRADCNSRDNVFVSLDRLHQRGRIGVERGFDIGPIYIIKRKIKMETWAIIYIYIYGLDGTYQIPRTTLNPFALAAGTIACALSQSLAAYVRTIRVWALRTSKSSSKSFRVLQVPSAFLTPRENPKVPAAETTAGPAARASGRILERRIVGRIFQLDD